MSGPKPFSLQTAATHSRLRGAKVTHPRCL